MNTTESDEMEVTAIPSLPHTKHGDDVLKQTVMDDLAQSGNKKSCAIVGSLVSKEAGVENLGVIWGRSGYRRKRSERRGPERQLTTLVGVWQVQQGVQ